MTNPIKHTTSNFNGNPLLADFSTPNYQFANICVDYRICKNCQFFHSFWHLPGGRAYKGCGSPNKIKFNNEFKDKQERLGIKVGWTEEKVAFVEKGKPHSKRGNYVAKFDSHPIPSDCPQILDYMMLFEEKSEKRKEEWQKQISLFSSKGEQEALTL